VNKAAQALGRLGGKAGTGAAKARTSEQARAAVAARWAKTVRKPKRSARRSTSLEMAQEVACRDVKQTKAADCGHPAVMTRPPGEVPDQTA